MPKSRKAGSAVPAVVDDTVSHASARTMRPLRVAISVQQRSATKTGVDTTSPSESSLSSMRQSPSESAPFYETPGTTPGTTERSVAVKHSSLSNRKFVINLDNDDEIIQDAALAAALQEEEYSRDLAQSRNVLALSVADSESELSEVPSLSPVLQLSTSTSRRQSKQSMEATASSSRAPRARATSSKRRVEEIEDSDASESHVIQPRARTRHAGAVARKRIRLEIEDSELSEATEMKESESRASRLITHNSDIDSVLSEPAENDESDFSNNSLRMINSDLDDSEEEREDLKPASGSKRRPVPPIIDDSESDMPLATRRSRKNTAVRPRARAPRRTQTAGRRRVRSNARFGNISREQAEEIGDDIEAVIENMRMGRKERERKKLEKSHPSIKTMWEDLAKIPIIKPVPAEQPASINRRLKPFQLEGLDWMVKQEKTQYGGGLLGDEMGMGKTIQAVSLIMSDYPQKQPTLVLVPPVALMQWSSEITDYTDGKLKVLVYHGQNSKVKGMTTSDLKKFDVIMISYNSLESLYRKETKGWTRAEETIKEKSPIHAIHFHRLILDEAHSIKSRTTGVAKACFALRGTYKWCLSGTPVQNRIGEFFSLLRFLEVRPFADYFCKRCPCSIIHWQLDDQHLCKGCKHSGMEHVSVFNQELLNPLTQSEDASERSGAMDKLHMITARIMLRRMKRDHTSSMELPPKEVIIHNEFFGDIERDFSSSIMSNTNRTFDTYVARGVMLNNYANIFGLIMQMRQVSNHPDLLLKKHADAGQNVLVCNICDEVAEDAIRSQCKHDFCRSCAKSYVQSVGETGGDADCPRCHIPLAIDFDQPEIEQDEEHVKKSSIINRIKMENWTSSTKIEMLIYDLYKLRSKKQTLKSIVFSQFTSMLQLIEWRLRRAGFNTVMLDGSMTPTQRQRSIEYFMNNPDVEIFLVSLKAGGVALNLTEASRVFIVDPWWNPAAEWQSADRCHRIGQRRPCVITRLCIEDSVESRIVMLQEKKANMINGTINNDRTSMEKLTPEDMQFLFRGS